jgi:hypothetical protein
VHTVLAAAAAGRRVSGLISPGEDMAAETRAEVPAGA